jgi:hypothetical protein
MDGEEEQSMKIESHSCIIIINKIHFLGIKQQAN